MDLTPLLCTATCLRPSRPPWEPSRAAPLGTASLASTLSPAPDSCDWSWAGNVIYARNFGDFAPDLQSPQQEREQKPYVNMFRVVNVDDLVPKVSALFPHSSMRVLCQVVLAIAV